MKDISVHIVDDEAVCIKELSEEINWEAIGISRDRVIGSTSARMARTKIHSDTANIIICDVEMPGESGLEFTEWTTEWGRFSEKPVITIMLTCHPEYCFIRKAMQLGCMDYVLKPADKEEMTGVIKKAVARVEEQEKRQSLPGNFDISDNHKDIVYGKIIPYIMENLTESFSVDDIAEHVSLNPQYMMRLFKKSTGKSVLNYVTDLRLDMAKELLLKTDYSIENITEKIGYFSVAHFSQMFKKREGVAPGQYRKTYR